MTAHLDRCPLFQNRTPVADFPALVDSYEAKEFASPTRSTVPLLMLLRDAPALFEQLLATLGVPADTRPSLHLEYQVDAPRGKGLPSHTDLMVRTSALQLALEIKWGEPRYPDVARWLGGGDSPSANKIERLAGWLDLIQPHVGRPLHAADFGAVVYQMLHRAASACEHAEVTPRLAYVVFDPPPGRIKTHAPYADDLRQLASLIAPAPGFSMHLVRIGLTPTPAFEALRHLPKGASATIEAVREAVVAGGLFAFDHLRHEQIAVPTA